MKTIPGDAQTLLNQMVMEWMKEQKRKRRFRFCVRLLILLVVFWGAFEFFNNIAEAMKERNQPHVGLIDIEGEIASDAASNADDLARGFDTAFKNKNLKAVILRIDSPGGSPVQADYMYSQIRYQKEKHPDTPIYAVCTDMCASAAYYVAAATDEIYANPSSMVGSIGVLFNGFGFVDTLQKVGVQRRLYTAGKNKGFLDPFLPADENQVAFLKNMLNEVHHVFIEKVKLGRGQRLQGSEEVLFSGLFWTGLQAKQLGLIDDFASVGQLARDKIKVDHIVDYTVKKSIFDKVSKNMHTELQGALLNLTPRLSAINLFTRVAGQHI